MADNQDSLGHVAVAVRLGCSQEPLKQIVFGIRDIWASETVEDAKAIEKFVW
jgi:hypothetical protein